MNNGHAIIIILSKSCDTVIRELSSGKALRIWRLFRFRETVQNLQ